MNSNWSTCIDMKWSISVMLCCAIPEHIVPLRYVCERKTFLNIFNNNTPSHIPVCCLASESDMRCWTIFSIILHKKGVLYFCIICVRPLLHFKWLWTIFLRVVAFFLTILYVRLRTDASSNLHTQTTHMKVVIYVKIVANNVTLFNIGR